MVPSAIATVMPWNNDHHPFGRNFVEIDAANVLRKRTCPWTKKCHGPVLEAVKSGTGVRPSKASSEKGGIKVKSGITGNEGLLSGEVVRRLQRIHSRWA